MANKQIVRKMLYLAVGVMAMLASVISSIGITQGRFNKNAIYSTVCGKDSVDKSTLSAEKEIFDFGVWQVGDSDEFSHTILLESKTALKGKLRFTWDNETKQNKDIVVLSEGNYSGSIDEYEIEEKDKKLEFPFSLVFSPTQRIGFAYLDVEWIPEGSSKASLSARYLLTLNPDSISDDSNISYQEENTNFISKNLLQFSIDCNKADGVMLSPGASILNKFEEGLVYYTKSYPQGIKLIKSSILHLPRGSEENISGIINLKTQTFDSSFKLAAGTSFSNYITTSQTPTETIALSFKLSGEEPILSHTNPIKFVVKEDSKLIDSKWNSKGSNKAEVEWIVERLNNGNFEAVKTNKDFKISVSQNDSGGKITISAPTGNQAAGTYRLTVSQTYKDYLLTKKTITFYIDYR